MAPYRESPPPSLDPASFAAELSELVGYLLKADEDAIAKLVERRDRMLLAQAEVHGECFVEREGA